MAPLAADFATGRDFLTARWRALAILSWEIDPAVVRPLVPAATELDFHEGRTYVSLVGFLFLDARLLGVSIPWHRDFEEVNLRYYLRRRDAAGERRAVAFVREIVPRRAIAGVARFVYHEPYVALPMRHRHQGFAREADPPQGETLSVEYEWRWRGRWLGFGLACRGAPALPAETTLEAFIAEHHWGYCRQPDGGTIEYRVEHPPWRVWPAERAWVDPDVANHYPGAFRAVLAGPPSSAFLADGSDIRVGRPRRVA